MKSKIVIIPLALLIAGMLFVGFKFIEYKIQTKTPKITQSAEDIIAENQEDLAFTTVSTSIRNKEGIYTLIHQMANTIIKAENDQIRGKIAINDQSVNEAMKIVSITTFLSKEEKEILLNILQAWKKKDFSNGVEDHNYVWKKLDGEIGRAIDLLPQYK